MIIVRSLQLYVLKVRITTTSAWRKSPVSVYVHFTSLPRFPEFHTLIWFTWAHKCLWNCQKIIFDHIISETEQKRYLSRSQQSPQGVSCALNNYLHWFPTNSLLCLSMNKNHNRFQLTQPAVTNVMPLLPSMCLLCPFSHTYTPGDVSATSPTPLLCKKSSIVLFFL